MPDMKTKTKLNERLTIWQMADLFGANIFQLTKLAFLRAREISPLPYLPALRSVLF